MPGTSGCSECLAASHAALGDRWLDVYLTSPAWRFVFGPGACGPSPVIGLMAPSVDRVGRYFPLTLVAELPQYASLLRRPLTRRRSSIAPSDWSSRRWRPTRSISSLRRGRGAARRVPRAVERFLRPSSLRLRRRWRVPTIRRRRGRCRSDRRSSWRRYSGSCLSLRLSAVYEPLALWWTEGSAMVEPRCLITPRPAAPGHVRGAARWIVDREPLAAGSDAARTRPDVPRLAARRAAPLRFDPRPRPTSAGREPINEDGFVERPEAGCGPSRTAWAATATVRSRAAWSAMRSPISNPTARFDETIESARHKMREVNDHLLRIAERSRFSEWQRQHRRDAARAGRPRAVLWAGDSRAYRWRAGRLEQLSQDHSLVAETDSPLPESIAESIANVITRAVGLEARANS